MLSAFLFMQPQGQDAGGSLMSTLIMFGLIFVIFYFMIIRPQQKRQREREQMLNALKKGDKVVTAGGVHGTIVGIDEKTLLVQIADNVKVKVERGSISTIVKEAEPTTK
ncbi:MAG TPA: preprotein translocase subunit YajC [Bacteroidota bacterium]|nr:preprotein translocase subunit YajC [Bacteroidota bacterium]